uniref:Uncharacterized protein n=1 Tax=Arundo donax TaxID=35708 RepID=A0A0A9B6N9_ARUDO
MHVSLKGFLLMFLGLLRTLRMRLDYGVWLVPRGSVVYGPNWL